MVENPRRHRLELPNSPNSDDPKVQAWMRDIRRLTMDEFNRLSGDFFDFKQEVINSAMIPLASVAAITVVPDRYSAIFTWENPVQTQGDPTHVRVRIVEFGDIWAEYDYPITTWTAFGLSPGTDYTFQIQLVRREQDTMNFVSALRNCPSLPVEVESLSQIRSRAFATTAGVGVPVDDGGGNPIIPIPPTDGTPGSVGGTDCWWEWQLQIVDPVTGLWGDTIYGGQIAGDAGTIPLDITLLDTLRVYRIKYREVCNGVPGPWIYGPPFTGGADWNAECGGNDPSDSVLSAPGSSADLFAIPYICFVEGEGIIVREYLTGVQIVTGIGYDLPVYVDGEWNLVAVTYDDSLNSKVLGSTFLPALEGLTNGNDLAIMMDVWMTDLPSNPPGGFHTDRILDIGGGQVQINVTYTSLGKWGVQFVAPRETGGNIVLNGLPLDLDSGYTSDRVVIFVAVDQDGDKSLYLNGVLAAQDTTGQEVRLDGLSGALQIKAFSTMWIQRLYGWSEIPVGPAVTINQKAGQSDPAFDTPILFEAVFDQPVTGFVGTDVLITGTAGATVAEVSTLDNITYTIAVSGMTGSGTVIVNIPAGVCASMLTGLLNLASTSTDNTVTFDSFDPITSIAWHAAYWAQNLMEADAAEVLTFPDEVGAEDLTGISPKVPVMDTAHASFNNKKVLDFNPDETRQLSILAAVHGDLGSQPFAIVTVAKFDDVTSGAGTGRTLHDGGGASNRAEMRARSTTFWSLFAGTIVNISNNDLNPNLFVAKFNGASSALVISGTFAGPGDAGTDQYDGLTIGYAIGASTASHRFDGQIAFVGVYYGDPESDPGWADFEAWVTSFYGITVA